MTGSAIDCRTPTRGNTTRRTTGARMAPGTETLHETLDSLAAGSAGGGASGLQNGTPCCRGNGWVRRDLEALPSRFITTRPMRALLKVALREVSCLLRDRRAAE